MQILPNNILSKKNLDFRLKLGVEYNAETIWSVTYKGNSSMILGSSVTIEDDPNNPEAGLDMDFEIERTENEEPNICKLTIWNLSQDTFNQISNEANKFYLYYARGNNDWSLLFVGSPSFASQGNPIGGNNDSRGFMRRDDAVGGENDIPTIISLEEALNEYENATISKSYQGYCSTEQIIKDCADVMGFPLNIAKEIEHTQVHNYVARDNVGKVLSDIVKNHLKVKYDLGDPKLTYDNNNVNIFAVIGEERVVFDDSDIVQYGYVFNPENSTRPEKEMLDKEEVYRFTTQLLPDLIAGNYCKCEFPNLSGRKQIRKVVSIGNNYGTQGETEVTVSV